MHVACRRLRDRLDPDKGCSISLCATLHGCVPEPKARTAAANGARGGVERACDKDEQSKQQKEQATMLLRHRNAQVPGSMLGEALAARLGPAELAGQLPAGGGPMTNDGPSCK
jgi:hypothetical protein